MPLPSGTRLGPYEILAPIGAGGMGEVYRAAGTKLGRQVAVKIIPGSIALDLGRMARLARETVSAPITVTLNCQAALKR